VAAVETFVEKHYREQLHALGSSAGLQALRAQLEQFCHEQVAHQRDASARASRGGEAPPGRLSSVWSAIVGLGSMIGVAVARRV